MSGLHSPDPARKPSEEGQDASVAGHPDLAQKYHALCDDNTSGHRRLEVRDETGRAEIRALYDRFRKIALGNADYDTKAHPERIPENIPRLSPRVLESEGARRFAFYTEMLNCQGERMLYADLRFYRYAAGPVAMGILTARETLDSYAYYSFWSPAALREDVDRIDVDGMQVEYSEYGSFVFMRGKEKVEEQLQAEGVPFADIIDVEVRHNDGKPIVYYETTDGWFSVTLELHPRTGLLDYRVARSAPPPAKDTWDELEGQPPLALSQTADMRVRYHAMTAAGDWREMRQPESVAEDLELHRTREATDQKLLSGCGEGISTIFEEPLVAIDHAGVKWLSWLVYCVDSEGRTMFREGRHETTFQRGLVAYCVARQEGTSGEPYLTPLWEENAFMEELALIAEHRCRLLYPVKNRCEILNWILQEVADREERGAPLTYKDVMHLDVRADGPFADILVATTLQEHELQVEWDAATGGLVFVLDDDDDAAV